MGLFAKMVKVFFCKKPLIIFAKSSTLNVGDGSECASGLTKYNCPKVSGIIYCGIVVTNFGIALFTRIVSHAGNSLRKLFKGMNHLY